MTRSDMEDGAMYVPTERDPREVTVPDAVAESAIWRQAAEMAEADASREACRWCPERDDRLVKEGRIMALTGLAAAYRAKAEG